MIRASFLAPVLLLGGCVSLLPEPPPAPRLFVLEAHDVARAEGPHIEGAIAVAAPTGERSLLGADLIWRTGDELAFVDQTQWSNRADAALQAMLIETLLRQGRFDAAVRPGEARTRYDVRWDVLDFEVREEAMQARFSADVRVVAAPGRRVIAASIITTEAAVGDRSSSAAARALARAAREGAARIAEFAADAAAQAAASETEDQASAASISR